MDRVAGRQASRQARTGTLLDNQGKQQKASGWKRMGQLDRVAGRQARTLPAHSQHAKRHGPPHAPSTPAIIARLGIPASTSSRWVPISSTATTSRTQ